MLNEPHSVYGYEKRVYQRPGLRRQACSPLIQLFFGFASDIDQTNINRDIRDGNWLSTVEPFFASLVYRSPKSKQALHFSGIPSTIYWRADITSRYTWTGRQVEKYGDDSNARKLFSTQVKHSTGIKGQKYWSFLQAKMLQTLVCLKIAWASFTVFYQVPVPITLWYFKK